MPVCIMKLPSSFLFFLNVPAKLKPTKPLLMKPVRCYQLLTGQDNLFYNHHWQTAYVPRV